MHAAVCGHVGDCVWVLVGLGCSLVGCVADCPAGVGHVVHQDGHAVLHISDQHHAVHLVGLFTLFVDERKLHIQPVGNGGHPKDRINDIKIAELTEIVSNLNHKEKRQGSGSERSSSKM